MIAAIIASFATMIESTTAGAGYEILEGTTALFAVYREGAEVILFFALQSGVLRIPLKPFFLFTSVLMYLLAITFAGGGAGNLSDGRNIRLASCVVDFGHRCISLAQTSSDD